LAAYGISGGLLNWITNFLSNRVQAAAKVGSKISEYVSVKSGVPQGIVIGLCTFLVLVATIVDLYADDVKIYGIINDVYDVIRFQPGLDALKTGSCLFQSRNFLFFI